MCCNLCAFCVHACLQFKAVHPVGDRVFVKVDKEAPKSIGGVLLPSGGGKKSTAGTVVALGEATTVKVSSSVRVVHACKPASIPWQHASKGHAPAVPMAAGCRGVLLTR